LQRRHGFVSCWSVCVIGFIIIIFSRKAVDDIPLAASCFTNGVCWIFVLTEDMATQ